MSPLDIVHEIVSYCTALQHLCTREETVCIAPSEESTGRISSHSGAPEAGTLRLARLAGITTCGAFKDPLRCDQELCTCRGARYAVHNQAHRISIIDTIAVTVIKIVVV